MSEFYTYTANDIHGQERSMAEFKDNVVVVVNTASRCGFTPQYKGLEALYQAYKDRGLVILGFPCNQFLKQEPGTEAEIAQFCESNYGVTFPLFAKVEVRGAGAHPLFRYLTQQAPGVLGTEAIKWNFTKFVLDRQGKVCKRFAPKDKPDTMRAFIESLL